MVNDFSHLQMINYDVQIGDKVTHKVGIFNCNKLPTGIAVKCIETDTANPYLITMTRDKFISLFLDDNDDIEESTNDQESEEDRRYDSNEDN